MAARRPWRAPTLSEPVRLAVDGPVATVTLDRPPLNVLDLKAIAALGEACRSLGERGETRVVVVRGAGSRAFSAGVAIEDHTPERVAPMLDGFHAALDALETLDAVSVAAVRGHCLGGGMELAAACDLVVAAEDARFGQPEIALGCYPPWAAARYPARFGAARAADLVLTGRVLDAAEAERLGLVSRRAAAGDFDAALAALVDQLRATSAVALRLAKRALRAGRTLDAARALAESERLYRERLASSHDMAEGVRAFLDKRPPRWQHR